MAFEQYLGQRPRATEPKVSIRKNGQIVLNHKLIRQYEITDESFAHLLYDSEAKQIGIKIDEEKNRGARKLTMLLGSALISGGAFLKTFGINHEKARKFDPDFIDGMIVIDLNE